MLLEFGVHYTWAEKENPDLDQLQGLIHKKADLSWFVLANMVVAAGPAPCSDGRTYTELTLRSGQAVDVIEPIEDVLDALSYVTRHISVTPGVVDKVDGEREEMYPWRRREKVTELAKKWRAHQETLARGSVRHQGAAGVPFGTLPADIPPLTREGVNKVTDVEVSREIGKVVVRSPGGQSAEAFARSDAETSTARPTSTLPKDGQVQPVKDGVTLFHMLAAGARFRLLGDEQTVYMKTRQPGMDGLNAVVVAPEKDVGYMAVMFGDAVVNVLE